MMAAPTGDDPVQLTLLHGFTGKAKPPGVSPAAAELPVARVLIESPVPHLDREFDYLVPEALSVEAVPGARVKVRFGGREVQGYITGRYDKPDSESRLVALHKVVSAQPVALPVLPLARRIAARYAGSVADVLRVAIPPRVARVDQEFTGREPAVQETDAPGTARDSLLARYTNGPGFLRHLAAGEAPRAVLTSLGGFGAGSWAQELAEAIHCSWQTGRGALAVVPDSKDLQVLQSAVEARLGSGNVVRLAAEDGPTVRYRNFLKLLHGQVRVAVGTRSAAYAPVQDLGLVCLWDDGDDLHGEQRAPYQHVREVLLLRAEQEQAAALLSAFSRSTEAQRLTETGWARSIEAPRPQVRNRTPRVVHSADSYQQARDPLARQARIPHAAWQVAKSGLEQGPVLIQVARSGFAPALACENCREQARCRHCTGPLALGSRSGIPACRWCGIPERSFVCRHCGSPRLRTAVAGAVRTAEDLGRAFPAYPVVSSSGNQVKATVPNRPAIVVATPGAEPVVDGGYAAALLLDGDSMLLRESLRAAEDARRRWFNAAALVRPAGAGGVVVITAGDAPWVAALVRWDPAGAASRELTERRALGLPPAQRSAALTGSPESLTLFLDGLSLPGGVRTVGPVPVPADPSGASSTSSTSGASSTSGPVGRSHRLLLFFSYADAATVTAQLRARRASQSAKRTAEPVHVRCDAPDVL